MLSVVQTLLATLQYPELTWQPKNLEGTVKTINIVLLDAESKQVLAKPFPLIPTLG